MPRTADLVERVNQGALVVGLECIVEVYSSSSGRVTEALPVDRDGIPGVLDMDVIPRWWDERHEVGEGSSGEDGQHKQLVVTRAGGPKSPGTGVLRTLLGIKAFTVHFRVRIEAAAEPRSVLR